MLCTSASRRYVQGFGHHTSHAAGLCLKRLTDHLALQESVAVQKDLMTPLYTHRKVLGVIGICHGPASQDVKEAYELFDQNCRWAQDAHCRSRLDLTLA